MTAIAKREEGAPFKFDRDWLRRKIEQCPDEPGGLMACSPELYAELTRLPTMGNWVITIEGTGMHHNNQHPKDADVLAKEIVKTLKEAGQHIEHATFTSGGRQSAMPAESA